MVFCQYVSYCAWQSKTDKNYKALIKGSYYRIVDCHVSPHWTILLQNWGLFIHNLMSSFICKLSEKKYKLSFNIEWNFDGFFGEEQ
jgi:hypothetical protein